MILRLTATLLASSLMLGACSSRDPAPDPVASDKTSTPPTSASATPGAATSSNANVASEPSHVLGLEGLGDLRIGKPIPKDSSWAERGAQTGDACRTVSAPEYPGIYAIVAAGTVRRITVGQRSDVKLIEGIGVGASETEVKKWFAGFREEPHKYEPAPAKYLTAPNAEQSESALRFEIGQDGRVRLIHVGIMPELAYVEGCA